MLIRLLLRGERSPCRSSITVLPSTFRFFGGNSSVTSLLLALSVCNASSIDSAANVSKCSHEAKERFRIRKLHSTQQTPARATKIDKVESQGTGTGGWASKETYLFLTELNGFIRFFLHGEASFITPRFHFKERIVKFNLIVGEVLLSYARLIILLIFSLLYSVLNLVYIFCRSIF